MSSFNVIQLRAPFNAGLVHGLRPADWLVSAICDVQLWSRRRRIARALNELSDHLLDDVGISRAEITTTADRAARSRLARQYSRMANQLERQETGKPGR